jgi:hypothetical protein
MKLSKIVPRLTAVVLAVGASLSAHAGYVVLDGWELVTPTSDTKQIGRLNLVSGSATVVQEVNGTGSAFVGAKFSESGLIYSISYTKENVVGTGDIGAPTGLPDSLSISFSNVAGSVVAVNAGGGFKYVFTSGSFTIAGTGGTYANGSIVGIGGNASSTNVIGGINGDSTLLASVLSSAAGFDLKDSLGVSLLPAMATGNVLFEAVTNNLNSNLIGTGACTFATAVAGDGCATLNIASAGDAYLVKSVPEPGSLALAGLALFGLASLGRRGAKKS